MPRNLPAHVKIMSDKVIVKMCRTMAEVCAKKDALGTCDVNKSEIRIYSRMPDWKRKKTLVHEVLHYILQETGATGMLKEEDPEEDLEEKLVCCLELGLYSFLSDTKIDWSQK